MNLLELINPIILACLFLYHLFILAIKNDNMYYIFQKECEYYQNNITNDNHTLQKMYEQELIYYKRKFWVCVGYTLMPISFMIQSLLTIKQPRFIPLFLFISLMISSSLIIVRFSIKNLVKSIRK